mgnify:FL=1
MQEVSLSENPNQIVYIFDFNNAMIYWQIDLLIYDLAHHRGFFTLQVPTSARTMSMVRQKLSSKFSWILCW